MLFQTYYRLDPWQFEPPVAEFWPVRFDHTDQKFSLRSVYVHGHGEDDPSQLIVQVFHLCEDVPREALQVFAGEFDDPFDLTGGDGFGKYPLGYREFILKTHAYMDRAATEMFNVIRWRFGVNGGPLVLTSEWSSMRWQSEHRSSAAHEERGFLNSEVPAGVFTIHLRALQRVTFSRDDADAIEEMFRLQASQPLYHDLFREAQQSRSTNPRSALVMAIAAAETAFKTAAVDLCNNQSTEWLFENLQSPPLDRMVRECLQLLPARRTFSGEVRRPPKAAIRTIKEGIELRNKVVHGRTSEVDQNRLDEILFVIRDLLYLLDYYRGHDWAVDRLSPDFAAAMRNGDS